MEIKVFNNNVEKALKVAKKKLAGEGLFRDPASGKRPNSARPSADA